MGTALEEMNLYIGLHKDIPREVIMRLCEYTAQLEADIEELREALKLNMDWIGPPPTDKHSYDSLREAAWAKGKTVLKGE